MSVIDATTGWVRRDSFSERAAARLAATGWVILESHRYEPTVLAGLTPSGRAFSFRAEWTLPNTPGAVTITITVAGRTRSVVKTRALDLHDGNLCLDALLEAWNALPASQR